MPDPFTYTLEEVAASLKKKPKATDLLLLLIAERLDRLCVQMDLAIQRQPGARYR